MVQYKGIFRTLSSVYKGTFTNGVNHLRGEGGTEKLTEVDALGGGGVEAKKLTLTTPNFLVNWTIAFSAIIGRKISMFIDHFKGVSHYFRTISSMELAHGSFWTILGNFRQLIFAMYCFDPKSHKTIIELYSQRYLSFNFPKQIGQLLFFLR